jgi:hypothetical protein
MAFKLRSQSPIKQSSNTNKPLLVNYPTGKFTDKVTSEQSLNREGKAETHYYRGGHEVSAEESNILKNKDKQKATQNRQDYNRNRPNATVQSLMDPTGVSQWDEAKLAYNDLSSMAQSAVGIKSKKGYDWDFSRAIGDVFDMVGAVPIYGKFAAGKEGFKLAKSVAPRVLGNVSKKVISHLIPTAGTAATNEYIKGNKKKSPAQQKSPLLKQKLSPKAAKAKAARDLAYAKSDDRTAKKAHAQRMHRKNPGKKGMDYDHEDGRFESVKQNRGNEGEGTKKESGKNYKVK